MPAGYPHGMHLNGTIRRKPAEGAKTVDGLETRTIVGTGTDYDEARADLNGQVPEGWQLLNVQSS